MPDYNIYTREAELEELKNIILKHGVKTILCKNDFFVHSGDVCNEIAYIQKGCCKYSKTNSKGKERIIAFAFEDEFIANYIPARNQSCALLNIQAMEKTTILKICMDEYPSFFQKTIEGHTYIRKFVEVIAFQHLQKIVSLTCKTPEERYFELQHKVPDIFYRVNLKEIASYIGTSPETLSRMRTSYLKKTYPANS